VFSAAQVDAYFERIRYDGPRTPDFETLRRLHVAHLENVPFENLDIHWRTPIVLREELFFDKIVNRRRGGFCYELNGAFAALLETLGYRLDRISAEVNGQNGYGLPFDHLALIVYLDERWLADVGFGDGFLEPQPLDAIPVTPPYHLLGDKYRFTLTPHSLADFVPMCHYQQSSPESFFTRRRLCTQAAPFGRVTLGEDKLVITRDGERTEHPIAGEEEWRRALETHFGIRPPDSRSSC
jgi:N-hydroxyarylamine O-acetyltransferase